MYENIREFLNVICIIEEGWLGYKRIEFFKDK